MIIFNHELRKSIKGLLVWTGAIGFMLFICMIMYPEMKSQMGQISDMFADLGAFSDAFGMNELSYGTAIGFYGTECGNILGLGGGFFAAIIGIGILAKEEGKHTAEFLLSHPISRTKVLGEKYASIVVQILILNIIVFILGIGSFVLIGETIPWNQLVIFHFAQLIMQIEIASICFGISAFLHDNNLGLGIGIAVIMYFMNIAVNISESAKALGYITPFTYADPAKVISQEEIDLVRLVVGIGISIVFILLGFIKYNKKDIAS